MTTHPLATALFASLFLSFLACGSGGSSAGPLDPGSDPPGEQKGSLRVTTITEGDPYSQDGQYLVAVDGEVRTMAVSGVLNFLDLSIGGHVVELDDIQENCVVAEDNPRTVVVLPNQSIDVPFSITCATLTANLAVKTISTGAVDPDGYTVTLDGGPAEPIGINETKIFRGLATGRHELLLGGMDGGCALHSPNPRVFFLRGVLDSSAMSGQSNFHVEC